MRISDWSSDVCSSDLWPLFVGWASLALFIVYAAIASMGLFAWLPINWHLAGPVGLFESVMVTLALGLNLQKIRRLEEHMSELQSLMRTSSAAFFLDKKNA